MKNEAKIVLAELQDLSRELQEVVVSKEGCFYKYREKQEIGKKIYADIMKKYEEDGNEFVFSEEVAESGILSQLQGFATVLSLYEDFEIDAKDKKAQEFIDGMLDYLIANALDAGGNLNVDASPYLQESSVFDNYNYVDSITWIISSLLGVIRLHIKGVYLLDLESERGQKIVDIYVKCMNYLLESFIDSPDLKRKFNCGWNFTKDCEEPSLYFTFAVSEILIDMLNTFENVIRAADVDYITEAIHSELDGRGLFESEKFKRNFDKIQAILEEALNDDNFEGYGDALRDFSEFSDEERSVIYEIRQKEEFVKQQYADNLERIKKNREDVQREIALFDKINEGKSVYDSGSLYKRLEDACKKSAYQIWELTRNGLAQEFYSFDLESKISEDAIASSVSSDAIFNVIFVINILINAGLDEDFEDDINYFTFNGSDAYKKAMQDYDDIRDTLRLAYDNCYQYFTKLKKENKEYKISDYSLNFNESFVRHLKNTKDIRKAHIHVFSLMPLLVRTKTTMGEFLIQYPQYDMIIYLENILKYRCWNSETSEYQWIWENDGYSTSSNYYFVTVLADFYDYYNKYEYVFHSNINKNKKARKEIEERYYKSLQEAGKAVDRTVEEFDELKAAIGKQETVIADLKKKIEYYENDPLRSALNQFIEEALQKTIMSVLATKLSEEASRIISEAKDKVIARAADIENTNGTDKVTIEEWTSDKGADGSIEKGVRDILFASLVAEQLGETIYSTKMTKDERFTALEEIKKYIGRVDKDTKQAIRYYLQGIADSRSSSFVANKGESTLPVAKHIRLMELLDKKSNKGDIDE